MISDDQLTVIEKTLAHILKVFSKGTVSYYIDNDDAILSFKQLTKYDKVLAKLIVEKNESYNNNIK